MHHSWYNFWDWIPPGWHHVVKSAGDGFRQKMSAKRKQCWAVSSAIDKHMGLMIIAQFSRFRQSLQSWERLRVWAFPWWIWFEAYDSMVATAVRRAFKKNKVLISFIWPWLIFYTLASTRLPRPQVDFPSAPIKNFNLTHEVDDPLIWIWKSNFSFQFWNDYQAQG